MILDSSNTFTLRSCLCLLTLVATCSGCARSDRAENTVVENQLAVTEAKILAHQEFIASCMMANGFEYVAAIPNDFLIERAESEAHAAGRTFNIEEVVLPVNPNDELVGALSDSDRQAYDAALWSDDGCFSSTYSEAWGVDLNQILVVDDELQKALDAVESDPRIVSAGTAYLDCMGRNGFPELVDPGGTLEAVSRQEYELRVAVTDSGGDWESGAERADFEAWRTAILTADLDCGPPYYDTVDDVRNELIETFATRGNGD